MKKTQPIKERLNAHLDMLEKLDALKLELQHAEEQYGSCGSPNYSGVPGGGHRELTQTEAIVHRKIELEKKVAKKQAEIDRDWAELEPLIEQLKPIETLVLNLRYFTEATGRTSAKASTAAAKTTRRSSTATCTTFF